jgi:hypothetical protein
VCPFVVAIRKKKFYENGVFEKEKKTFKKDSPSQGSWFRRVRFETESGEKHRVPRFRGTLD